MLHLFATSSILNASTKGRKQRKIENVNSSIKLIYISSTSLKQPQSLDVSNPSFLQCNNYMQNQLVIGAAYDWCFPVRYRDLLKF